MCLRLLFLLTGFVAAQQLETPRLTLNVENTAQTTLLTATEKDSETPVTLRIDWFTGTESPAAFKNETATKRSIISTHLLGKTKLTRTIILSAEDDTVFFHAHSNQPGPVHFTARFVSEEPVKIRDRRQLILSGKKIHAHAWIIPYESDVSDDGKATITIAGEGEALIILNLSANPSTHPIPDTLTRLGEKHDPGQTPPNPHLIWEGVTKR